MIKPEELRIGNLVCIGKKDDGTDEFGTVDNLQSDKYRQWNEDDNEYTFDNNGDGNYWLCDEYYPIPLSPEYLTRFGFKRGDNTNYNDSFFVIDCGSSELYINPDNGVVWIMNPVGASLNNPKLIEHVHSLQNLFYALTGSELTL